jgi:poly(A) polymerase
VPALGQVIALAEDARLAQDFPLAPEAIKAIVDETAVRFSRDHLL